jgi:hypothetical protein
VRKERENTYDAYMIEWKNIYDVIEIGKSPHEEEHDRITNND